MATAQWRKVIVSGSTANLSNLQVDGLTSGQVVIGGGSGSNLTTTAINGTGNIVATTGATGVSMTGSFTGSFVGNGSGLTGVTATAIFPTTAVTTLATTDKLFVSHSTGQEYITYANVVTELAGTNLTTGGAGTNLTLASTITGLTSVTSTSFTGSLLGTASYASQALSSSYATTASYAATAGQTVASLTQGAGISSFTFNGSSAQTVAVAGAASLTTNYVTKWNGSSFVNSSITDDGTTFSINGNKFQVTEGTGDTTIAGNLTVNGTTTFINTQNVYVKDAFLEIASGSTTLVDAGFIAQYNAAGSGSAFFLSSTPGTYGRFAVAYDQVGTVTSVTPNEYMVTVKSSAGAPGSNPTWGGGTYGYGNMYVNSSNSDIYIYA